MSIDEEDEELDAGIPRQRAKAFPCEAAPSVPAPVTEQPTISESPGTDVETGISVQTPISQNPGENPYGTNIEDIDINDNSNSQEELTEEDAGIPVQRATSHTPAKEADCRQIEIIEEIGKVDPIHRFFTSPFLAACLVICLSTLLIIVLSEVFQFIQSVQSSPLFLQVIAYSCIGVLTAAFGWAIARLTIAYRQLVDSPQVRLDQFRTVRSRAITRDQIERQVDAGYEALRSIVEKYPIKDPRQTELLRKAGMKDEELDALKGNIASLLKKDHAGRVTWIRDCERLFINTVDRCAKQRVKEYARRVGVKTATCPTGLFDSLIVVVNAVFMIEELCRLYFVRTNRWHSFLLALQLVFSTFISARLEDRVDELADTLFGDVIHNIPGIVQDACAKLSLGLLKRASEGTINYVIFYRLGASAIYFMRPIRLER